MTRAPAALVLGFIGAAVWTRGLSAEEFAASPHRSFLVNVSLGGGLDVDRAARTPLNYFDERVEAYSLGAFVIDISAGFRFNEVAAVEGGWHEVQHRAPEEWGGRARYAIGHTALRLAWPLKTRQTPVLKLGPAVGRFSYGAASYGAYEDNDTLVAGGIVSAVIEHELTLGIVAVLAVTYLPLCRFGMEGELFLEETRYTDEDAETRILSSKDFTDDQMIHLIWITAGIQFEWTFR